MPDFIFDTIDSIPEDMRGDAKKNDAGKFVINLVQKTKVDEFRETNVKVAKERDALLSKLNVVSPIVGDDPEAFAAELKVLRAMKQQVDDGKLKPGEDVEKALAERTTAMRTSFEEQAQARAKELAEKTGENAKLQTELRKVNISHAITSAVLNEKSGALPLALPHILQEAYKVFTVEADGSLVPKKGDAIIYGTDGATPMTPMEFLHKLRETASYLFKPSAGGGAAGNSNKDYGGLSLVDYNKLSPQAKLQMANRAARK
ncbi:MAG: hypothetical protein ABI067_15795 [Leifsonia sp.]